LVLDPASKHKNLNTPKSNVSTYFDESHIQQVLQAINIVEVIGNYVSLQRRGKEMVGLCPFHNDSKPSLNVNTGKQIFKCFACGAGGNAIQFIMRREQMTFPESVRFLAQRAGVKLPEKQVQAHEGMDRNELEKLNRWAAKFFRDQYDHDELGRVAREYVENRFIRADTAKKFGLGWAPNSWDNLLKAAHEAGKPAAELARLGLLVEKEQGGYYDRFRERLIFPVIDALGRVIGFGGRTLGDDPAKYINSPESVLFNKSRALYGLHVAKDSIIKERTAVLVEGYTDCIVAHQFGLANVVATLGTALTREHAEILSRYADTIVVVFDSDAAGEKAADRAVEVFFAHQVEVKLVSLPEGKDPCDFLLAQGDRGKESFEKLVSGATESLEYKWQNMERQLAKTNTVGGHKRAVDEYLMMTAQLLAQENIDNISRGYLLNRVAKLVGMTNDQAHRKVNDHLRRMKTSMSVQMRSRAIPLENRSVRSQREVVEQEILEVLLNRGDLFEQVRKEIGPDEFSDPVLRQIAQRLWDYFGGGGNGSLAAILAGCESTELCNKITDMAEGGSQRENFEVRLERTLKSLRRLETEQSQQELHRMTSHAEEKYGKDAQTALLLEIQTKRQKRSKDQSDPGRSNVFSTS